MWRRSDKARKSRAGRKPWDAVVMFKTIILSALYNLSDDLSIRSGIACSRCQDSVAVPRTVDASGVIETLFETFDGHLKDQGYLAMGGQIIDASIVAVPKQRNSRKENARIKAGEMPECWQDKPAKRRQKDVEARCQEARQEPLRLQVSTGPSAQAGAALSGERRGDARQFLDDILDGDSTSAACPTMQTRIGDWVRPGTG